MKTNVRTKGNFLLSRDAPQTDRQTDERQNYIIQKPSKTLQNSITPTGKVKSENVNLRFS